MGEFPFLGHGKEPEIKPHCEPGIGIMDVPGKKWVLGDTLLRRYYSIYDDDRGLVGFVRSLHPDESVQTPIAGASDVNIVSGAAMKATGAVTQASMGSVLGLVAGIAERQRAARTRPPEATQNVNSIACRR